ncbi:MAG: Clp protease ClpP, partial [Oscillospiraceae bacterium]|nr:Clp protease ClpP [Oscillospiraceae bacterium]
GETVEASLTADRKIMMVAGVRHDVSAFHRIPGIVPINKGLPAKKASSNIPAAKAAEKSQKEEHTMTPEEIKAQYPEVVAEIETAAKEAAAADAVAKERKRLAEIEAIQDTVGDPKLVHEAKYGENPLTAEQLALKAMQNAAKSGAKFLSAHEKDVKDSGVEGVQGNPEDPSDPEGKGNEQEQVNAAVALFNQSRR